MDSDDNFMVYRRFGFLYSRLLLDKQDELREIEEDLDSVDNRDASGSERVRRCLQSRRKDDLCEDTTSRRALLKRAEEKLYAYGNQENPSYLL